MKNGMLGLRLAWLPLVESLLGSMMVLRHVFVVENQDILGFVVTRRSVASVRCVELRTIGRGSVNIDSVLTQRI